MSKRYRAEWITGADLYALLDNENNILSAGNAAHLLNEQVKEIEQLRAELNKYKSAVALTINENLHLADGDVCTLRRLTRLQPEEAASNE